MTKISDVKLLFHDYGSFSSLSPKLGEGFKEVMFYSPAESSNPKRAFIADGLPNVTVVDSFWRAKKELDPKRDLIVFFDVGEGALQEELRSQGYNVFGMGNAEELEADRMIFKEFLKKAGLPVVPFEQITGVENLDKYLQKVEDKYVKVVKYRGLGESFHHVNYNQSKARIKTFRDYGEPFAGKIGFNIDDPIKAIESGSDHFISTPGYYDTCLYGYEAKGCSYSAKVIETSKLPKPLKTVLVKSIPYYKKTKPRGMFSTEVRIDPQNIPHYIDATQRGGLPPIESIAKNCKNFNEAVYAVAKGEKIKLEWEAPYVSQIELKSMFGIHEPLVVEFPDKIKSFVFLLNVMKVDGLYQTIPQVEPEDEWAIVGSVVGLGKTLEESRDMAEKVAKQIVADSLQYDPKWSEIDEEIAQAKKQGLGDF
jgi:hypothetical protein